MSMYNDKRQQQYLMEQQYINEYYNNYQSSQYQIHPHVYSNVQNPKVSYAKQQQKLQKLQNHIIKLKTQLEHPTIQVSIAAASLIKFTQSTYDPLIPKSFDNFERVENPYTVKKNASCNCTIL